MTNSANGIQREIKVKGQIGHCNKLYLGAVVSDEAPNQRFSQGLHKPLHLLKPIWRDNNISLGSGEADVTIMPVNHGP